MLSYTGSSPLVRMQCIFCNLCHSQFSILLLHQAPITARWTEVARHERFAQHLYTWPAAWLVTRAPVTLPGTNRAQRCFTLVIWQELVTTWPCDTIKAIGDMKTGKSVGNDFLSAESFKYAEKSICVFFMYAVQPYLIPFILITK